MSAPHILDHGHRQDRAGAPLRIVRLANFVTPVSGGLRTALRHLGAGYLAAGHRPVLIVPGARYADEESEQGRVITVPGPSVPGTGGYRVLTDRRAVARLLAALRPDRIEVSDRTTLRWTGAWARRHRVPAVMVSHESVDGVLRMWGLPRPAARFAADRLNSRTARAFSRVVCTTSWAAAEFERIGARNVVHAPLGVDLEHCRPALRTERTRCRYAWPEQVLVAQLHPAVGGEAAGPGPRHAGRTARPRSARGAGDGGRRPAARAVGAARAARAACRYGSSAMSPTRRPCTR